MKKSIVFIILTAVFLSIGWMIDMPILRIIFTASAVAMATVAFILRK